MINPDREPTINKEVNGSPKTEAKTVFEQKTGYSSDVLRFYNEMQQTDEHGDSGQYYNQLKRDMGRLASLSPDMVKRVKPEDVSMALAEMSGHLALGNPSIESNLSGDEKIDEETEKRYRKDKGIFMESCSRIYPDVKPVATAGNVVGAVKLLEVGGNVTGLPRSSVEAINPKYLDSVLYIAGKSLQQESWGKFQRDGNIVEQDTELAKKVKALYELQLIRDELQKLFYGNENQPVAVTKEIDRLREQLNPKQETLPGREHQKNIHQEVDPKRKFDISERGVFKDFYGRQNSVQEVRRIATEQAKKEFLAYLLRQVDNGIQTAKELYDERGSLSDRKSVLQFCGLSSRYASAALFQKMAIAGEGKIMPIEEVVTMSAADYLKKYFGYDLTADKQRAEQLKKYTNALK